MDRVNFLYISITWLMASVGSQVVSVTPGSTALLPCDLSRALRPSAYVQWRTDYAVVFERGGRDSYQGDRYKGRVDVSERQLLERNCSLLLENVWISDAGVYYSYLFEKRSRRPVARFIQRVELQVHHDAGRNFLPLFLFISFIVSLLLFLYSFVKRKLMLDKITRRYDL